MTRASVITLDGDIVSISVSGHSGYAMAGGDIVCAAISCLTTTCVNALETVAGLKPIIREDESAASLSIALPEGLDPDKRAKAQIVLKTTLQGLKDVSGEYPKYFHLTIIDGRKKP